MRLRLFPILIVVGGLALLGKLGGFWVDTGAFAQSQGNQEAGAGSSGDEPASETTTRDTVETAFSRFEEGIPDAELERVKAQYETRFYRRNSSVLGKAFRLAHYNIFAPSPGYFDTDLGQTLTVDADDVMRVYERYVKGRPRVETSFVPRGRSELAIAASTPAEVVIEPIVQGAEGNFTVVRGDQKTPPTGDLDRSIEPPFGEPPALTAPRVERDEAVGKIGEADDVPIQDGIG